MNKKGVAMFGYDTKEEVQRLDLERDIYAYPPDRQWILAMVGAQGSAEYEVVVRKKSGEQMATHCALTAVRDESGTISTFRGIIRDITERKRAEEDQRAAAHYARSLIEASLDPLVTITVQGKINDANKSTEEVTGVGRDHLVGTDFADYFTEPDMARAGYQEVLARGFVRDYPLTIRHSTGRTTDVLYNATVYRNAAGELQGVFAAARDITQRKQAESRLAEQLAELRQWHDVTLGRETRILDVKHEVNELLAKSGLPARYPSAESDGQTEE
jgi:PAS domain S-box-containing protein